MTPEQLKAIINAAPKVSEVVPTTKTGNYVWPTLILGGLVIGLIVYCKFENQKEKATHYMYRG